MLRKTSSLVAATLLAAIVGPMQFAGASLESGSILQTGDYVSLANGPGSPGGIFYLRDEGDNKIIDTFCVQIEEYISFGKTYQVANAMATSSAGIGSRTLTSFAAWLFDRYLNGVEGSGPALSNFDFGNAYGQNNFSAARIQANELQLAIWLAMGYTPQEIGGAGNGGWYDTYSGKVAGWEDDFESDVANSLWSEGSTGDVYVVNLLGQDSSGNFTVGAQDQLIRIPSGVVPEPLSAVVWSVLGVVVVGAMYVRRSAR